MKKLIPFKCMPAAWGLRGKSYDVAEAHYSLEGMELELRLAELEKSGDDLERAKADILKEHGVLSEYEWMRRHIEIEAPEGTEREVELTKLDIEFGKTDKRIGEKKIAALLNEPWVSIVEEGLDQKQGPNGFYFVFDWNEHWITLLRQNGYEGSNDDELMEKWFTDVCRNEVLSSGPLPLNTSVIYGD